jgi:hypothetical protein
MATNTYVALDKVTVGTAVSSVTLNMGSTLSQAYTDLEIVINATSVGSSDYNARISFNGDTSSGLYSWTLIRGNGSSASSLRYSGQNDIAMTTNYSIMQTPSTIKVNLQNYSNSSVYKTILGRFSQVNPAGGTSSAFIGLWRNTNAITSITVTIGGDYFAEGSTFSLYGIANSDIGAPKAFGGTITQDATYTYHTFGASGTFTPQQSLTCDYIVVAGGGGGGGGNGGGAGGGAGGLRSFNSQSLSTTNYTITIGAGGAGGTTRAYGAKGVDSSAFGISASGGGQGGYYDGAVGTSGGSGGGGGSRGGAGSTSGGSGNAGSYSPVEGYAGGTGSYLPGYAGGGGGGAGSVGSNATTTAAGAGGVGIDWLSLGTYYAGGGGGGANSSGAPALGGLGGGGNGTNTTSAAGGTPGTSGTGGGGGGGGDNGSGNAGGSGVVIIRYAN